MAPTHCQQPGDHAELLQLTGTRNPPGRSCSGGFCLHDTLLSLRQRLKHATAGSHTALENRVGPLQTPNEYNEYARGMHAFRSGVEAWLTAQPQLASDWRPQHIAAELTRDMDDLALRPLANTFEGWSTSNDSFVLGVHYVLEGSALGARILCKQVEALGLSRDFGARHLWAQAENPQSFRGYLDLLNTAANVDEVALIQGVNAAFSAAAYAMERAGND